MKLENIISDGIKFIDILDIKIFKKRETIRNCIIIKQ